jgi:hypothetical protein
MNDDQDDKRPRHQRATLALPATVDLKSVDQAEVAVILAAAEGKISSRVALDFTLMLDHRRKAITDLDFEQRLDELKEATRQRGLPKAKGT